MVRPMRIRLIVQIPYPLHLWIHPANSNISVVQGSDYQGLDCLDEGTLEDDATLYGSLASTTSLPAVEIQDRVFGILIMTTMVMVLCQVVEDNGSSQFELTDGSGAITDTMDIVYADPVYACILETPTVTLSTGETKSYLLNDDDCNDILDFSDGVYTRVHHQVVSERPIKILRVHGMRYRW